MNPRLVKFAVELQNAAKLDHKEKCIHFIKSNKYGFFNVFKTAKVSIPVENE